GRFFRGGWEIGAEFEAPPIPREPLDQQAPIGMPIDPRDVALVLAEVQPGRRAAVDRDHAQLDSGILRAGKGIAMLLDLERWLGLVYDRKDRNVRLVDLLKRHQVPAGGRPVTARAVELLLGD